MIRNRNKGFSLIELSIVLVIIGLVSGGVIAAQSLIKASETRSVYDDITKYALATSLFDGKYSALPGDMSNAFRFLGGADCPDPACNGDGDGKIEFAAGSTEYIRAWQHLSKSGFIEGQYTGALVGGDIVLGVNVPVSKLSGSGYQFENISVLEYPEKNYIFLGGELGAFLDKGVLTPEQSWNIDKKYDDGLAGYGNILTTDGLAAGQTDCAGHYAGAAADSVYDLDSTETDCLTLFYLEL